MGFEMLIPSAIGAIGTLLNGKKKPPAYQPPPPPETPRPQYQAPTYNAGPQYQGANYQAPQYRAGPQYQSPGQYQAQTPQYNPMQGQLAQGLSQQFQSIQQGGSALPEAYRTAVLDRAKRSLGAQRDLDEARSTENLNKMGLLSSGALGVRLGQMDQGYAREYSNLEDSLMQADLGERNNLMQTLMGLGGQQLDFQRGQQDEARYAYGSQADIADKQYSSGRDESNRAGDFDIEQALRQYNSQQTNADNSYSAGRTEVDRSNSFNQTNAQNQYNSQSSAWDQQRTEQLGNANALYQNQQAQYQTGQQQSGAMWGDLSRLAEAGLQPQYQQQLLQLLLGGGGGQRAATPGMAAAAVNPYAGKAAPQLAGRTSTTRRY